MLRFYCLYVFMQYGLWFVFWLVRIRYWLCQFQVKWIDQLYFLYISIVLVVLLSLVSENWLMFGLLLLLNFMLLLIMVQLVRMLNFVLLKKYCLFSFQLCSLDLFWLMGWLMLNRYSGLVVVLYRLYVVLVVSI